MQVRVRPGRDPRSVVPQRVRLSERRRKRRLILGGVILVVLLVLFGVALYVMRLPAFTIQVIEVRGMEAVSEANIRSYVESQLDDDRFHLVPKRMIFTYPEAEIQAGLRSEFPRLDTVAIRRPFFFSTAVRIEVTERTPYALWCADVCYFLDATGFVYAPAEVPEGYIIVRGGITEPNPIGSSLTPTHIPQMRDLLGLLPLEGFVPRVFTLSSDTEFEIELEDGLRLRGSFDLSNDAMVGNLLAALDAETLKERRTEIDYIDLRFGNRVYYKFRGE